MGARAGSMDELDARECARSARGADAARAERASGAPLDPAQDQEADRRGALSPDKAGPASGAAHASPPTTAEGKQPRMLTYTAAAGGDSDYKSWSVSDLRKELGRRGLNSKGVKHELIARCETTPALAPPPPPT